MNKKTFAAGSVAVITTLVSLTGWPWNEGALKCWTLSAVDGDTIKCNYISMRDMGDGEPNVSGYDAPEFFSPRCERESLLGERARQRMKNILKTEGVWVVYSGKRDSFNRPLVWVGLPTGVTAGHILVGEKLAAKWAPGYKANWCRS